MRRLAGLAHPDSSARRTTWEARNPRTLPMIAAYTAPLRALRRRSPNVSPSAETRLATQKTKSGEISPSLNPPSMLSAARTRRGTRSSRRIIRTGARSMGMTTSAATARSHQLLPGKTRAPARVASRREAGRAIPRSRPSPTGPRSRAYSRASVASVNSMTARTSSMARWKVWVSTSSGTTGWSCPLRRTPAAAKVIGAVMLHRASRSDTTVHRNSRDSRTRRAITATRRAGVGRRQDKVG